MTAEEKLSEINSLLLIVEVSLREEITKIESTYLEGILLLIRHILSIQSLPSRTTA